MDIGKKCYRCLAGTGSSARICPKCGARLGARTGSGIAKKPGSPALVIFLAVIALMAGGKLALSSRATAATDDPGLQIIKVTQTPADKAIADIKERGAANFSAVGIADIGHSGDTLCLYVDQRYLRLSQEQQGQLLSIVTGEWAKAIGKTSFPVRILEHGTEKILSELR